jgi:S-adenosylmethionine:tRNA ribosyltransferase-isomerase
LRTGAATRYCAVLTSDFHFALPEELIAQFPSERRDESRMMILHRATNRIEHRSFRNLVEHLRAGDVLVLNDSKVIAARLRAASPKTGGAFEILLLEENAPNDWWTMMRPAKRARVGSELALLDLRGERSSVSATVLETNDEGHRRLRFQRAASVPMANFRHQRCTR